MRLTLSGTSDGVSKWANVFHLYVPGSTASDLTEMTELVQDTGDSFESSLFYAGQIADFGCDLLHLEASDGTNIFSYDYSPAALVGTDTGDHVTGGICAVVSWQGAWHYRGGKPRTYVGGLSSTWMNTPVLLDSGHCADLQSAAVGLITQIGAQSGSYGSAVVLGVLLGNTASSAGTFAPFSGARVTQQVGSQRRRNHAS